MAPVGRDSEESSPEEQLLAWKGQVETLFQSHTKVMYHCNPFGETYLV